MTHVYAATYQAVKTAQILENPDLEDDAFVVAQMKLACTAHDAYERLRGAARPMATRDGWTTKESMVVAVADVVLSLHETHADTGTKIAATPEYLAAVLSKLAAAVMVDEVILEQLPTLEGASKTAAESCQLLGREYILSLIAEVLP